MNLKEGKMKIYKEAGNNFLVVGRSYFIATGEDKKGNVIFEKAPKDKFIFFIKKIIPKLRESVDKDKILWSALSKMSLNDLKRWLSLSQDWKV